MTGLGEFMKSARRRVLMPDGRRMSQEDLAEATGLAAGTIGQIENGRTQRHERETLERIAVALRVTYNDLAIAADMADPPSERDIEAEIRRLAALDTIEAKMDALRQLSPEVYDLVEAWAHDLVRQAGQQRQTGNRPAQAGGSMGTQGKPTNGLLGC